ncbi:hypothetical protein mRhiFer1_008816 [Rhinolophus ferrumequinum]|uniref:Uncharacterized protein n=1 Tax=Rhinolophus ferrumequinum TaxID=59479 RepID=A0A7J8AFE7_RHIFE|nr:hypothetical protein mRhiFer1_008816 [Rhinolophus ferrumequinum]
MWRTEESVWSSGRSLGAQAGFKVVSEEIILPAGKRVSPQGPTSAGLGEGDPGLGASQPSRKNVPTWDMALEGVIGSKSSQTMAQKGKSAPERPLRKQKRCLFPCLHPEREGKKQENPQKKGSPIPPAQSRSPEQGRAALIGTNKVRKSGKALGSSYRRSWGIGMQQISPAFESPFPPQ